ncbi:tetratricopeptide repeat protein [Streptomyces cinereoruber]|uniref:Tetratricopeptide repeat protein n=1 Tax=Streptomyces cinereoruber TaxID=67260 RepID=A0ABX6BMG6_9ACTN|nr:tetratricopeptide repeat protein [Streptomyces cinereoruber]MBB4162370.1 tetratricopeptide (TPR) repeat protein [Streptomyces cinereoruber]MBY8820152.1 tetratricopeptide repeat protein [Streptomyces cinereoruber]NIH63474.1 tetratricopeptide (TPR) repeat protein [Streptomyces cinereoruber]QEV36115.1 tetratricopeptide repeat protein [Streptomyces cinereoruber]
MLDTPEAVVEALRENHERPHGTQRTVTAEELVEAAEVFDKPDTLVTALLELMTAYEFTGEQRKSPVAFARLLKLWDTAPESFSPWEAHQVFWRFKWVTTSLLQVPEVPLDTVRGWIDRMRERYEEAGHGMQPVAAMRHHVAAHIGTGVDDAYDLWVTRPRTELSDCEACETRHRAGYEVAAGDDAAALDAWRPVLAGEQSCSEEPQTSQARALLPLLRLGRTDEARSHHLTGYRRVRGNTGMQHEVGLHLEFCALSRNEGRGLEVLAENRPLFEATGAPLDRLGFLTGVEVLLARLVEDGHGETPVAGPPGRNWTAGELLGHVRGEADRLAAAFDARNGTTAVGDRRRERLARRPLLDAPLPLGLRTAAAPRTPAGAAPAVPAAAAAGAPEVPEDFAALVAEARHLARLGHPGADRLWTRISERLADGSAAHDDRLGPEELLRAELAEERAYRLKQKDGDAEESGAGLETAAGLYEELGMPWQALAARARALAWTTGEDDADAGRDEAVRVRLGRMLGEAERLKDEAPLTGEKPGDGETALGADAAADRVLSYLTVLYAGAYAAYQETMRREPEEPGPAPERFEEAVGALRAEAERLGVPHQVANARQFLADVAGRRGDLALAESELRAALVDVEASERPWRGSRPRALLAQVVLARQEPAEAAELLHRAIADAVRYGEEDFPLAPTYSLLGHASSHLGDHTGAVRHLSEAAARFDREGEHPEAADVRMQLAGVLTEAGRQADAVAVLESLLSEESAAALDERMVAQIRLSLARGLRELEEYLPSAEEFLRLAGTVAGWEEDAPIRTLVTADTAVALALADRWEAAEAAYERALAAHAEAPNPPMIVRMAREFARLTTAARGDEGVEAALAHLARADGVLDGVPADAAEGFAVWYERGEVHYRRSHVLAEAQRFEEALAEAEAAIGVHEEGGEHGELPRAEAVRFAALVEGNGLGRTDEAIARLTTAAARCRNAGRPEAAQILTALREEYLARPRG